MAEEATLVFDIDSSRARTAATDLARVQAAAQALAGQFAKTDSAIRRSNGQWASSVEVVGRYGDEVRRLAAEFNPTMNAIYQMQEAETRLNRAIGLGVVSMEQKDAILSGLAAKYSQSAVAAQRFGQAQQVATHHSTNLMYQLNDISMMMALGQNPFMLMMQQGPQVAQIFSTMNAEGRKIGPTLLAAFRSLLNPMTFLTLAVIGGSAALVQWGMSALGARDEAEEFENVTERLRASVSALDTAIKAHALTTEDLQAKYGQAAAQAEAWLRMDIQRVMLEATAAMSEQNDALGDSIRQYATARASIDRYRDQIAAIERDFSLSGDAAEQFRRVLSRMLDADGISEFADRAEDVRQFMQDAGIEIDDMPSSFQEALLGISPLVLQALELERALSEANASASGLVGNWAQILTPETISTTTLGAGPTGPKPGRGGGGLRDEMQSRWESLNEGFMAETQLAMEHYQRDLATLSWALEQKRITQQTYDDYRNQLRIMQFGSEYEQQMLQYQLEQEALQAALEQKLLTQQEYNTRLQALEQQHQSAMASIRDATDQYGLNSAAGFFGDLYKLSGSQYDKLLRAQQIFAAASALVSTYQGAAQALTLPFPGNIAAAAKVIAAGMGFVNAIRGGGKSSGGSSAASSSSASPKAEPTRNVMVRLEGPDFMVDMAESIMTQIYDASKDGRVIISRDTN